VLPALGLGLARILHLIVVFLLMHLCVVSLVLV
jgi:hypothetical protein